MTNVSPRDREGGQCGAMSNAYGKPKSVKLTAQDEAALAAANDAFGWVREAELLRIAIRVGLESLSKDPTPLGKPPVKPEVFRVPPRPASDLKPKQQNRAGKPRR